MSGLLLMEGQTASETMQSFVSEVLTQVTSQISLTSIVGAVGAIIGAGVVAIFGWKFARKGFAFVKNALSGRNANI